MMNSCDVLLVDKIGKKFDELDLYKQGGVTYIKIALDEMSVISNTVSPFPFLPLIFSGPNQGRILLRETVVGLRPPQRLLKQPWLVSLLIEH
jgi:hypothetical protein